MCAKQSADTVKAAGKVSEKSEGKRGRTKRRGRAPKQKGFGAKRRGPVWGK